MAYHFAGGGAFFSGMLLVAAAGLVSIFLRAWWARLPAAVLGIAGAIFVMLSATPAAPWVCRFWMLLFFAWLVLQVLPKPTVRRAARILGGVLAASCLLGVLLELPHRARPSLPERSFERVYIIGDSISAGIGRENGGTWPEVLGREHHIEVVDLSRPGATTASVLPRVGEVRADGALVVLEIGGNDLLGRTSAKKFAEDLERLLAALRKRGPAVLMFELPLFPLRGDYGRAQRRLAARFEVKLIPKRLFARILTREGFTLDGLHLSSRGHRAMAAMVWEIVRDSMVAAPGGEAIE